MPAQVPRGNIYQDGEIGGARPSPFPVGRKGGRKTGWGGSTRRNGGFLSLRGTERTKLSQDGSPRRLNPFRLIPDRRELTVATTIVFSKTCPRSNAVGCLIIYEFRKYPGKLYWKAIVIAKEGNWRNPWNIKSSITQERYTIFCT